MNLIEAMRSGKPFKRKGHTHWYLSNKPGSILYELDLRYEDALADDWEIKEKTVTITESQLREIFDLALCEGWVSYPHLTNVVVKKLGLDDEE